MSTLGEELKREREMRGIPLQEIARQTKINLNYLNALEQDRMDILPGEFFIKGTIRAYAKCIGLDENQALNLYLRTVRRPSQAALNPSKAPTPTMSPGRWKKLGVMILPPLLLAAVLFFFKPWAEESPGTGIPSGAPRVEAMAQTDVTAPVRSAAVQEPPAAATGEALVLQLTFNDEVWIRVQCDDGLPEERLMQAGDRKTVAASDRVVMRLGRPDQVEMVLNGRKAKLFPASASAQTYEITKDNCDRYVAE